MEASRRQEPLAQSLAHGPLARMLANGGQLRWRILMLAVLLGALAVPLRRAFVQVAGEAVARAAVQDVVRGLLPASSLVSQQVDVGRDAIVVRLLSTQSVAKSKLQGAEREIERRSGRRAEVSVAGIASQTELSELMQRLNAPQPVAPRPPATLNEIHDDLMHRIQPAVTAAWPHEAPLQSFDLSFTPDGIAIDAKYSAPRSLDAISLELIQNRLRDQLNEPALLLNASRVPAPARHGKPER